MQPAPGDPRYRDLDDKIMQAIQERPLTSEEITARAGSNDKTVRKRLKVLPVTRIPDKRRVLYSPLSRTPPGPGDGNAPGGLTVSAPIKKPDPDNAEPPRTHAGPEPEKTTISAIPSGTIRTQKRMPQLPESGHPFSPCIVSVLKAEPDRIFHVRDVARKTGGKVDTVNRTLSRLSKTGKGSGPVRKISHGFYKYDPAKEQGNIFDFAQSGEWRIENLTLVRMGARGTSGQAQNRSPDDPPRASRPDTTGQETGTIRTQSDTLPAPRPGYPWYLVPGQEVFWGTYSNGTEIIRVSANGKRPLSIDVMLQLFVGFRNVDEFIDDEWSCTSIEVNKDSYTRRFEGTFTVRVMEAVLIKAYNHGDAARLEIANRRTVSLREVTDLFNYLQDNFTGREALKKAEALESRLAQTEKDTRLALTIARQVRDREGKNKSTGKVSKRSDHPSHFTTGTALKQEQAPAAAPGEPVS